MLNKRMINTTSLYAVTCVDLFTSHGSAGTVSFQHSLLLYSVGGGGGTSCAFPSDVLTEPGIENVERIFYVREITTNILI